MNAYKLSVIKKEIVKLGNEWVNVSWTSDWMNNLVNEN